MLVPDSKCVYKIARIAKKWQYIFTIRLCSYSAEVFYPNKVG
jgi:hypothetical protein